MLLPLPGDAEDELRLLVAPGDARGVLLQHHAGLLDGVLGLVGAVRDGDAHADVDAREAVALDHRVHVGLLHAAALDEQRAGVADAALAVHGGKAQLDVCRGDGEARAVVLLGRLRRGRGGRGLHELGGVGDLRERLVERVERGVVEEVVDRHDLGLRCAPAGALGQDALADDDARVAGDGVDARVDDGEVGALGLDAVAEAGGAHGGGAHAGVAGKDDLAALSVGDDSGLGGALHLAHLLARLVDVGDGHGAHERHGDGKGDARGDRHAGEVDEHEVGGRHREERDDRARGGGGGEARAGEAVPRDGAHVAHDRRDDDLGVHEHVREVDLVDAAEEVDDHRARGGLAGLGVLAEEAVREKNAEARAGVGLEHVHDGAPGGLGLRDADGREDAVVDGVVEEEHLGGLDEDGEQRHEAVLHEDLHAAHEHGEDGGHDRADGDVAEHGEHHADDADGEVVDEHLKARGRAALHEAVEHLDDPAGERAHDHGSHEHRGVGGAGDAADDGDGARDAAAVAAGEVAALGGDEHRDQVAEHGRGDARELLVGQPARRDEQGGQKAPGDEGADVGHDHAAEELTELRETISDRHRSLLP